MAKDNTTALVASGHFMSWSTANRLRRGLSIQGRGEAVVPTILPDPETDADENVPVIATSFAEIIQENAGQIQGEAILGLTTDELLLKVIDFPAVEDADLAGMIELQADKFSPFPIDQMTVSHEILKRTETNCAVLIAAAPTRYIERLGDDFSQAGIRPVRVDAAVLGWWHLLNMKNKVDVEGTHFLFIIDRRYLETIVVRNGVPILFRSFLLSDDQDIAQDVAGEIALTRMGMEIQGQGGAPHMSAWVAEDAGAMELKAIESTCNCQIHISPLSELGEASDGILYRHGADGLLNLTPQSWHAARAAARQKKRLIGSSVAVLGVWCLGVAGLLGAVYYEQSKLDKLVMERDQLSEPALRVRTLRRRVYMVEQYMNRDDSALECLREVASLQPAGIELSSFSYRKRDGDLRISGFGTTVQQVYDFKTRLDASPLFCESELVGPRRSALGETFEVRMSICKGEQS